MKSSEIRNELANAGGNNVGSRRGLAFGWGLAAGVGAAALFCDVEIDALVGADRTTAPGFDVKAVFDRTTMLVLTWMADLRADGCGGAFDCAARSAFASFTAKAERRSPRLHHHFQKNQPEHANVTMANRATPERSK